MAFALERDYSKNEILELYVNTIYFGNGYYCIKDASEGYFGKEPEDLTDYESTLLAGVPNAPSKYPPLSTWSCGKTPGAGGRTSGSLRTVYKRAGTGDTGGK